MSYRVQDIIIEALGRIGATRINETPPIEDLNTCLRTLNFMVDSVSAQSLIVRGSVLKNATLTANKGSYTIGLSGADITLQKPIKVDTAYIVDSANIRYPLMVIDKELYDQYPDANYSTGLPRNVCYDPGDTQQAVQKGTFKFYYIPDSDYVFYWENYGYLTEFATLTEVVTFEPAYYEYLASNLAVKVFKKFRPKDRIDPDLKTEARQAARIIRNMNMPDLSMGTDISTAKKIYNIFTDSYTG